MHTPSLQPSKSSTSESQTSVIHRPTQKVQQILWCNEYTFIVQACISVDFGLFNIYHQSSCRYFPGVFGFWPKIRNSYNVSLIPAQLSVTCRMESVEKTQSYSNLLKDGVSPAEYFSQLSPLHKHSSKIFLGAGYHQLSCLMAMYMLL